MDKDNPKISDEVKPVQTTQIGNKLFITDGSSPLRYVDLTTNKVIDYSEAHCHAHEWMLKDGDRGFRDEYGHEFVMDTYVCECGAGHFVKTPREMFEKGEKVLSNE